MIPLDECQKPPRQVKAISIQSIFNVIVAVTLLIICSSGVEALETPSHTVHKRAVKNPGAPVLASCNELKKAGYTYDGVYLIDPDGPSRPPRYKGLNPFSVTCDMTSDLKLGYTVVHHNQEKEGYVKGFEDRGSFAVDVKYDLTMNQIKAIKAVSTECTQFIKYKCIRSLFYYSSNRDAYQYWISVDGNAMYNWGGVPTGTRACDCWMHKKCDNPNKRCNCDENDGTVRVDQGYLTDKQTLPVTQLRFGDTGGGNEKGTYMLGPLQCA